MTRIDFYVLPEADTDARARFACRLAHKAWQQAHRVYLHTGDAAHAQAMDDLLWELPRGTFLPHDLWQPKAASSAPTARAPVLVGHGAEPADCDDVLINLTAEVPPFFERFQRVAEIVVQAPDVRTAGRARFKFYRERGYPLHHHDMQRWADD